MIFIYMLRILLAWIAAIVIAVMTMIHVAIARNGRPWEFWLKAWAKSLLVIVGVKVRVHGYDRMTKPAIFIMNHQSMIDILTLAYAVPAQSTFIAKQEIQRVPIIGWVMKKCGCIFVDRDRREKAIASIERGVEARPPHYSVVMFPEGTRSLGSELRPFKKGFYHIAKQTGLPVIPIGQAGLERLAMGKNAIKPGTLDLVIGLPIDLKDLTLEESLTRAQAAVKACIDEAETYQITAI